MGIILPLTSVIVFRQKFFKLKSEPYGIIILGQTFKLAPDPL